ncbi:hypothetical protein D9M68_799200 [compost metagenome]
MVIGKAIPDSIKNEFTTRDIALLNKTILGVKMDLSNDLMKTSVTNEGKSLDDLHYFLKNFRQISQKANLTKLLDPKSKLPGDNNAAGMELPIGEGDFDYTITATVFERKPKAKAIEAADSMEGAGMEMLNALGIKLSHTLIVNLPKPVKEVNDAKAVISTDKKQVKVLTAGTENISSMVRQHLLIKY